MASPLEEPVTVVDVTDTTTYELCGDDYPEQGTALIDTNTEPALVIISQVN
jgi:hypothetical protein